MIFKLQRPLNAPKAEWLVYSEGKPQLYFIMDELIPADIKAAMGDDVKIYFEGAIHGGVLAIERIVDDQDW